MKDDDVSTEYPADIDDQYITQDGFLAALPGEFTTISSAIALFRCSRVLANVLDTVYPINAAHEQTYRRLKELEDELDSWKAELAPHLRLEFVNGVPATNVVHSRSPLLVRLCFCFLSLTHPLHVCITHAVVTGSCLPLHSSTHPPSGRPVE